MVDAQAAEPRPPALAPETLYVERSGDETAPPVLLLHGWGSSSELMRPIARRLSAFRHVYNLDLPGHGRSPLPPAPWGVPEYADLVARFLDLHGIDRLPVVGHSNGGRIALYMASEPGLRDRIERLVLVSPSGIRPVRTWRFHLRRLLARILKAPFLLLPGPLREPALAWLRGSLVWRALGSSDYRTLEGVMRETFVRTVNHHLDDRVADVRVPTLIFWGDADTAVSRRQMETLEHAIPDAGLVVLSEAGHYGYLDDPAPFFAATEYFLRQPV